MITDCTVHRILTSDLNSMTTSLPIELWSCIFAFVPSKGLLALCLVSRCFRTEAVRALYRNVHIRSGTEFQWFDHILRKPHLAGHVQTLTFMIMDSSLNHLNSYRGALRALSNLQELAMHSPKESNAVEILSGPFTFRLKALRNNAFSLKSIAPFIESQPSIIEWMQCAREKAPSPNFQLPPSIVPNLQSLTCTTRELESIPPLPTISHLKILSFLNGKEQELQTIQLLLRFGGTLKSLALFREMSERSLLLEHLVVQVAKSIPHLIRFAIRHKGETVSCSAASN